eukprot:TRINITY_DN66367_c0_g1_i1.p1 TRINITY_DN66367_c0_g1~~TRINITY_DN66367_c0_g1_i1.p1  ORF type:complete len:232 (+),score=69.93 TRINITY_DN66367_c0_g1_i1:76-696(+)
MEDPRSLFIRHLPPAVKSQELRDQLLQYGAVLRLNMQAAKGPVAAALCQMETAEAAAAVIAGMNQTLFPGHPEHIWPVIVEYKTPPAGKGAKGAAEKILQTAATAAAITTGRPAGGAGGAGLAVKTMVAAPARAAPYPTAAADAVMDPRDAEIVRLRTELAEVVRARGLTGCPDVMTASSAELERLLGPSAAKGTSTAITVAASGI